mmetsp:Transcript_13771/g.20789  ORF Transcript_13771/g.20789 Transcript_13771/m.20789 type:complete len:102 (-) Transcript_13771:40-345(-)
MGSVAGTMVKSTKIKGRSAIPGVPQEIISRGNSGSEDMSEELNRENTSFTLGMSSSKSLKNASIFSDNVFHWAYIGLVSDNPSLKTTIVSRRALGKEGERM